MEFKGTKGTWEMVEYCGIYNLQSQPYYGERNLLNIDDVGKEEAESNVKLIIAAPDLLEALKESLSTLKWHLANSNNKDAETFYNVSSNSIVQSENAIKKALG